MKRSARIIGALLGLASISVVSLVWADMVIRNHSTLISGVIVSGATSTLGGTVTGARVSPTASTSTLSGTVLGVSPGSAAPYYPRAAPTRWYILPGQALGFSGTGFVPGETVQVSGDMNTSATVSDDGVLSIPIAFTIPFDWQDSRHTFTIRGSVSAWSITFTIVVGTFYPQISPSTYWVGVRQDISVSGIAFAPGEQVRVLVNGGEVAQTTADAGGNVFFTIVTPDTGASATITAQGLLSGLSSTRVIYLHL